MPGLLGSVAALLTVEPGHEAALAAALGPIADAVAVAGCDDAVAALELLRSNDSGRAGVADRRRRSSRRTATRLADAAAGRALGDRPGRAARRQLRRRLDRALDRVAVVDDLAAARHWSPSTPGVRAVTVDGDLLGADWAVGGSERAQSVIEVQAAGRRGARQARRGRAVARARQRRAGGRPGRAAGRRDEVGAAKEAAQRGQGPATPGPPSG